MDIFNLNYAEFERFLFVFFRVGALILFVPVLGSRQVPVSMKIGLILFTSIVIFPLVQARPLPKPQGIFDLAVFLLSDVT
ncbi:MAG: flagellar biosynthetic protein FliR, partial [Nitrospinaceae bacterium]|nr:flagellar biosynthetic protein FliR [Nitrospinaceae bacterium]